MKYKKFLSILLFSFFPGIILFAAPLRPAHLACEYWMNPLGIDTKAPRLSWQFDSQERNKSQSAYELIVSDDLEEIKNGKGKDWTTGRVASTQSIQVEYRGAPLRSFTRYYWRVKIYDETGAVSGWSDINWFETAMLSPQDWKADWIGDGRPRPVRDEDYYKDDPMPLLRRSFNSAKKIATARLYISGVGYYEAYLNGKKIGDHWLDPGWTAYGKQVLYVVHDITPMMKKGTNVMGILLGNGWWNPSSFKLFGRFDLRNYQQTGRPCVKAEIHITYTDGSMQTILTNEEWQTATGPVLRNNVYLGEHYDARLERKDWLAEKTTSTGWKNAVKADGPSGIPEAQMQPPIKVTRHVRPVSITETGKDTFIVNLGQNFAGVASIKVSGAAGKKITLRYGEGLFGDGRLNGLTTAATQIKKGGIKGGPGAPETAWQEDSYTLSGNGVEHWSPRFTFHGFQYIEITGWPGRPGMDDIEGLRMNAELESNGAFSCSNPMLTKLHEVIQWTFLSNVFSVQSDCPGREKMGYGADMVVTSDAFLYNYQMGNFYGKSVHDFFNDQRPLGGMTEIAPSTGINDLGYADSTGPMAWQLAFPFLQNKLYEFYGDKRIIEKYYPALQRQIAFLRSQAKDNLFYWDIGDHEALDPKPESFSASIFYYHHLRLARDFAGILGRKEDSLMYAKNTEAVRKSIVRHYLIPGTGRFDNATQSAQVLALWYEISPEPVASFDILRDELRRHNDHISTGIFSTKMLFDVLRETDSSELAYRIANQRDFPGWGNMLVNGATTLWETWAFPETSPSRNHPMFGSIDEWFYRSLLGINSMSPGFKKIRIKPQPAGDLQWAKGSYASIHGMISSDWRIGQNEFALNVTIPPNTTAEIWIPAAKDSEITENGRSIPVSRYEKGYAVVAIGSGMYSFRSSR